MRNAVFLTISLLALLALEAAYYSGADSWVRFFSPQPLLLASAFIGILFGSGPAVWWAAAAGLLEEFCFMNPGSILGITPLVYSWMAYAAGKVFHGRADASNPAIGLMVSFAALLFAYVFGALLGAAFGSGAALITGPWTWGRAVSWVIQIFFLGPALLAVLAKAAGRGRGELQPRLK